MSQYRKKPVVIEAVLVEHGNLREVEDFLGGECQRNVPAPAVFAFASHVDYFTGEVQIVTVESTMIARPGDWIIKGVQGEFYPCKPEIFAATYEPVDP